MDHRDLKVLAKAISELPTRCKYHGECTDPPASFVRREACCDAGVAAHRRKAAEEVLARLQR